MPARARYATPRTESRPTYGPAVGKLSAALGLPLMPWQQQVVDVALELDEHGGWAYRTVVIHVQRQAGKTSLCGPVNIHRCLTRGASGAWWTAQTRQDARDTWVDMIEGVRRSPLASLVKVRESNGSESATFPNGSTFRVFAPSVDALHGKATELVTVDEAWSFDAGQGNDLEASIVPTFTVTGGQLWLPSTAGTGASTWLRGFVERGRASVAADLRGPLAYFEWSLPPDDVETVTGGLDVDADEASRRAAFDALLAAHPAAGYTLRTDALAQAAATMRASTFLRAYGNVWTATSDRVIPDGPWSTARRYTWPAPDTGAVALAFDVDPDRASAAIVAAWRDSPLGPIRVDVVDARPGAAWVAARIRELRERWRPVAIGVDAAGPALDVADELDRDGIELVRLKARDYAAACAGFLSDVLAGRLEHPGAAALDDAVAAAGQRTLGDAWAWSRRQSSATIAPLSAATVARWAYDHRPPAPVAPVVSSRRRRVPAA